MIGTSDQSCWLAEACKILLLLEGTFHEQFFTLVLMSKASIWSGAGGIRL